MIRQYTFYNLITEHIIEVPIIQRDYAQGRTSDNVSYIRKKFVRSLVNAIEFEKPLHLGFVYGKIDGKDRIRELKLHEEAVNTLLHSVKQYANQFHIAVDAQVSTNALGEANSLRFIPLDGQQRLTTLFLLHWYILMRAGAVELSESLWLSNFKYNNRKSAIAFFHQLTDSFNITVIHADLGIDIRNQILGYTWYLDKWNYDPTVSGALIMLQAIHEEFAQHPKLIFEDIDIKNLPFAFDFLDLDDLKQSDELYLKMNERGKQLTDFEHFKSWLQDYTSKKYTDVSDVTFLKEFWKKLDTEWLDFFWREIDADFTSLDDFYFNYLKTMAITYHCATDPSDTIPQHVKNLLQQIRNSDSYIKNAVSYIPLSYFVQKISVQNKPDQTFELFSLDCLKFIADCFETTIHINRPEVKLIIERTIKSPFVSKTLVKSFIKNNAFTLNLWDHTSYYFLLRLFQNKDSDNASFEEWLRIFRNIIYNTYVQSPENLYDALHSINQVMGYGVVDIGNELQTLRIKFFNQRQIEEEVRKIALIGNSWEIEPIHELENHPYFYGQVDFVIELAEANPKKFVPYANILSKLFSTETPSHLLQQALLSKGDYLVERTNHSFCRTTTESLRSRNENWRSVFDNVDKRALLKQLLDDILSYQGKSIQEILALIIASHRYGVADWQFYFLENSQALEACKYDEIRWFNENDIRLLQSTAITGYHLELRTVYVFGEVQEKFTVPQPFETINYLWDKSTGGHPGIRLKGYSWNQKLYNLDIRYSFDGEGYLFYIYHEADSIQARFRNEILEEKLKDFVYDEDQKHYSKMCSTENIVNELEYLLKRLP